MLPKLSKRVLQLDESATLKMAQLARNLKAQGKDIISLTLGEPDFDTPEHIKTAAKIGLDKGLTKYTPVAGTNELRQAVCEKFRRDNGLHFAPEQIVVSNGAKQSFSNICLSVLDKGDEVVIFSPYWVSYKEIIELADGVPVFVYAGVEQNFRPTAEQLEKAITPNTRMLVFSSPCNPTGAVFSKADLAAYVEVLKKYPQVLIISDEIYEYINFTEAGHVSIASFEAVADRVVVINGFAKGFSMTGWRLGYIAAPKWLADACIKMQGQSTSGASSFGQYAAVTALLSDLSPSREMCAEFRKRRDLLIDLFAPIKGLQLNTPEGAFYFFPDISYFLGKSFQNQKIDTAEALCLYLLNEYGVALVSGEGFGAPTCLRISYATSEELLRKAVERIKIGLEALV